jgi:hypothetical protein
MSQQVRSSAAATAQLGGTRTSSGTNVHDVLMYLITIYADEESSWVSIITPILITKEGELG